jgi:hypothetical protein
MANTMKNQAEQSNHGNMPEAPGLTQPKQDDNQKNQAQSTKNGAAVRAAAKRQSERQGLKADEPKK